MGADLSTVLLATLDGVIAVTGTLWFLSWLRRRWPAHGVMLGGAARAPFATYVIHPLVLTAVMVAFAWVVLAPEIRFVPFATSASAAWAVGSPCAGAVRVGRNTREVGAPVAVL